MEQAIRHFQDRDHVFTGHEGEWTICGQPWQPQPDVGERCQGCIDAVLDYADHRMREGAR